MSSFNFDAFVDGYIECALWADAYPLSADPSRPDHDENWETGGLDRLMLTDGSRERMIERGQLREFVAANYADLLLYCNQRAVDVQGWIGDEPIEAWAGHDFWLTRVGHGAGFWDRGLGALGDRLTDASKGYGSPDDHIPWQVDDDYAEVL